MENSDGLDEKDPVPGAQYVSSTPPNSDVQARAPDAAPAKVSRTRASSFWVGLIVGIVALVAVLVFILQNLHNAHATFFGAHWDIPLGIDLLLAAILGGLLVFVAGSTRILQLRIHARRQHKALEHHRSRHNA